MKRIRLITRFITAFFSRFKGVLLIGIIMGILMFISIRFLDSFYTGRTTQRIAVTGRFRPDTLPTDILNLIGDGLTTLDDNGAAIPKLAKSWETPDKGKTWIFTLKSDIKWQDGKNVISEDLKYEFSDVVVERPSDNTIVFKLQDHYVPFPVVLSRPVFRKGLLGTGEWKVENISIFGDYIRELSISKGKSKRIYKFYPTEERAKLAFKMGQVNEIDQIFDPSPFQNWDTVNITDRLDKNQAVTIFYNTESQFFNEKSARQALTYAIDKKSQGEERAYSPISSNSWAYNPQVKKYSFDTKRAKELLENLPDETKKTLPIKLVSTPALLPLAETISRYWKDVGIDNIIQVSSVVPQEYDAFLAIFDIPKDPDQYSLWHTTQTTTNITHYSNPRINKLLEDGRIELNLEDRKKIYLDFQRFLLEDSPAAFLYYPTWYKVERK